ncbi:MAG: tetratricopeptide repeat protein [Polyangiaceae bacterium]
MNPTLPARRGTLLHSTKRIVSGLAMACALVGGISNTASADDPARDPAAAQALFNKALDLLAKDQWSEACPMFDASFKLDPSVGALINLGRCAEHANQPATAWAIYTRARGLNRETPGDKRRKDIDTFLDDAFARVEPLIAYLTVTVKSPPQGLEVSRDGTMIPNQSLGTAIPIDPGHHKLSLRAPGYKSLEPELDLSPGDKRELTLELELDPNTAKPDNPNPDHPKPDDPKPDKPGPTTAAPSETPTQLIAGIAVAGVGVLGLVASAVTGGLAAGERSTIDDLVQNGDCTENEAAGTLDCANADARTQAADASSAGSTLALASTITLFAGGAILITGVIVAVTGIPSSSPAASLRVVPIASPDAGGVMVTGAF